MTTIKRMDPKQAHEALTRSQAALFIDVRDPVEAKFVGNPIGARNIPWKFAPEMRLNPDFLKEVQSLAGLDTPIFLLCRSGQRSLQAAEFLKAKGFTHLVNIEEGFEGDLNQNRQRGTLGGWRYHRLPWEQT